MYPTIVVDGSTESCTSEAETHVGGKPGSADRRSFRSTVGRVHPLVCVLPKEK